LPSSTLRLSVPRSCRRPTNPSTSGASPKLAGARCTRWYRELGVGDAGQSERQDWGDAPEAHAHAPTSMPRVGPWLENGLGLKIGVLSPLTLDAPAKPAGETGAYAHKRQFRH
jgi:hypothetical protein